ncbi:MAG: thiamine pyrophosphate-binding protein [Acidimicrobiia bacterium]|nr:thiamine pyrophosphate-binding protein [Acidimicrobiia bacterium]
MLGSDLLVEMLVGYGVRHVFGVPGDTNVPFYEALQRRTADIEHVMARDERGAGFMADAYSRLGRRPGVFECPSGAGSMYSLPPVAEANASAIPVILLTIDIPLPGEGRGVITELDCARLYEPITKMSELVKSPEKIPEVIRRAFRTATSGTPGAVHLQIPEDLLLADVDEDKVSLHVEGECSNFPAYRTRPMKAKVDRLAELLTTAERPVIVTGGGVRRSGAGPAVTELAETLNIPMVTTITGQGSVPADHHLAIGVIGDNGFHPHANRAMEEAELVVFLGSKIGSVVTVGFTFPEVTSKRIVHVDIDPIALGNNYENELSIAGDVGAVVDDLLDRLPERTGAERRNDWVAHLNEMRTTFWLNASVLLEHDEAPLRPERVAHELNERLEAYEKPVHVLSDAGTPTPHMTRFLQTNRTVSLTIPRAYGGLGYAIPAVVGAWKADPDRRPIGLFGDGSLGMTAGELETLARLNVPAILMLFNNGCFGWIKGLHKLRGHREPMSVDFTAPDGRAIGEAFGIPSWTAETPAELAKALDQAFASEGPALIDVRVESIADRVPPVYSWLSKRDHDPLSLEAEEIRYFV